MLASHVCAFVNAKWQERKKVRTCSTAARTESSSFTGFNATFMSASCFESVWLGQSRARHLMSLRVLAQGVFVDVCQIHRCFSMALGYLALAGCILPLFLSLVLTFWWFSGGFDQLLGSEDSGTWPQTHHLAERHVPTEMPRANCTKFLLFTTQRSGSTWFCEALGRQREVYCPEMSELLIEFSRKPYRQVSADSAKEWTRAADAAFARVCSDAERQGKKIAGFKLMYDQVKGPFQTMDNVNLPEAWFKNYLLKSQVRVLHLVREAVILRLASNFQTGVNVMRLASAKMGFNTHHTKDAQDAAARSKVRKLGCVC